MIHTRELDDALGSSLRMTTSAVAAERNEPVRVLVVRFPGSSAIQRIEGLTETFEDLPRWETFEIHSHADAAAALASHSPDVCLVCPGERTVRDIRSCCRDLLTKPIVILDDGWTERDRSEALAIGVSDVLPVSEVDSRQLSRILWHSLQRNAVRRRTERTSAQRSSQWVNGPATATSVTAKMYGDCGLDSKSPAVFDGLAAKLRAMVEKALRQRTFSSDAGLTDDIDAFASEAGHELATARDLYQLHKEALRQTAASSPKRRKVVRIEAEYVLLGVMARLVGYYRSRAVTTPSSQDVQATAETELL